MTPDFRIIADSTDITAALRDRLLSLSVSDAAGIESDTLEISLDDRGGVIALPRTGAELAVELGYIGAGLQRMGIYTVDEVGLSGPPQQMTIRARAADLRQGLKKPRTRSWDEVWLADIVRSIAAEHGYEARVGQMFESEALVHIDQADESDLHFLTRLARERGAVAKPAGGLLLFVPAGEAKSASGKTLPEVSLIAGQLSRWEVTLAERGKYPAVIAKWFDAAAAKEQTVTAGSGEPVFTIGRRYPDEPSAASAAEARLDAFTRGLATLRLSCPGDPLLMAEGKLTVTGLRSGADGAWSMTRVTHRLDGGGYVCDIEAETPKESA
jgi:hypothetical protein